VATSDDAGASDRIAAFATSDAPWLVAVRMVSEGVDIPRLRVGVYATTTTTELFFRQAVGRLVRWTVGVPNQRSYLFIPDDARLRARAFQIAEVRRHSLRKEESTRAEPDPAALDTVTEPVDEGGEQMSLFAVISAVATDTDTHDRHDGGDGEMLPAAEWTDDDSLTVALPALARLGGDDGTGVDGPVLTRRERKQLLRDANAELARALVHKTGWPHAKVNAELNRLTGLRRVTEATVEQLEKRKRHAERWYTKL
jgi:superfamily II DNA or RNA helicase